MVDAIKLKTGHVLAGKYRIDSELARGGGGVVYAAHQLGIDRPAVVKTLLPTALADDIAVERFKREARVASQLRHPHAVTILDFGIENRIAYIVMERLEGRTVKDVLTSEGRMDPIRVHYIIRQLLEVCAAAHDLGVVHRDLKPSNIFLCAYHGRPDYVKVIDFGIARVTQPLDGRKEKTITESGSVIGSPGYIAPEILAGKRAGAQADLYAAGIVGHELLTGQAAFAGSTTLEKLTQQALNKIQPAPDNIRALPLYDVIERLMIPNLDHRYQTAEEALDDLKHLPTAADSGVVAALVPPARPVMKEVFDKPVEADGGEQDEFFEYASQQISAAPGGKGSPAGNADGGSRVSLIVGSGLLALLLLGLGAGGMYLWQSGMLSASAAEDDVTVAVIGGDDSDAATDDKTAGVTVLVNSIPDGAEVVGGGNILGQTPYSIRRPLSAEPLKVTLRKDGFKDLEVEVPLEKDAELGFELESDDERRRGRREKRKRDRKDKGAKRVGKVNRDKDDAKSTDDDGEPVAENGGDDKGARAEDKTTGDKDKADKDEKSEEPPEARVRDIEFDSDKKKKDGDGDDYELQPWKKNKLPFGPR